MNCFVVLFIPSVVIGSKSVDTVYDIAPACLTAVIFRILHNIDDKLCSSIWIK